MNILIIPSWYPKHKNDYVGCFFREQAIALSDHGHNVSVLAAFYGFPKNPIYWKSFYLKKTYYIDNEIKTFQKKFISWSTFLNKKNNTSTYKAAIIWMKHYIRCYGKPDIIHAHCVFNGGIIAKALHNAFSIPYILTEHATMYERGIYDDKLHICRDIIDSSAAFICVSNSLQKIVKNKTKQNKSTIIIPNLLSKNFEINNQNYIEKHSSFTFLNIAGLSTKKRHNLLIKSFAKSFKGENVFLRIAGNGEELDNLIKLTEIEGISSQITFLGKLTRKEVLHELKRSHVFVLSSDVETFGVVLIEALSQGLPLIATDCGGPSDIINIRNGILIPKNSVFDMASALIKIKNRYNDYSPSKIRQDCLDKYSSSTIAGKLTHLYKRIVKE